MPLLKFTNQPYFPDPNSPNQIDCLGEFCYPINQGDKIYQQWYQTPCGANLVTDPTFSNVTYGADLVVNGNFSLPFAPDWTTVGWVLNTGQAEAPAATTPNDLTQSVAIGSASFYRITFDVAAFSPGDEIRVSLGGGGTYVFDQIGSYDQVIKSGSSNTNLIFSVPATNTANALLDNVTLQLVTFNDWDTNASWSINTSGGSACANALGTGALIEDIADYIVVGDYYSLTFTVSGVTAGSVVPYISNMPLTAITSDGTFIVYATPTLTGVVSFVPSADFVGCISSPDLRRLRNDYLFEVIRTSDSERYDISEYIEYYEDKVTLASPVLDLLELTDGCYTIEVTDSCIIEGDELVTNGTFASSFTGWTRNNGSYQYAISANTLELIFEPLENGNIITNGDFSSGNAGWTFAGWTIGANATHTPGNTSALSRSITIGTPAVAPSVLVSWIQLTVTGMTAGSFTVTLSDKTSASYSANGVYTFPLTPTIGGVVTISITPTSAFDGTVDDIQVYQSTRVWSAAAVITNAVNTLFVAGNYTLSYDQTANDNPGNIETSLSLLGQTQSQVFNDTVATHSNSITGYTPGGQAVRIVGKFYEGSNYFPGRVTVDNVSAIRVEPFEATYTSECLDYQSNHANTKLLTGWSDQDAWGFDFVNTGFLLQMRIGVRSMNPFQQVVKNLAQFGTGDAAVKYASKTKWWQLATDYMSESAHDAVSAIISSDHFTIGTTGTDDTEYIAEVSDYTPEWRSEGDYSLTYTIFNIRLKDGGQLFNRHV